VLGDVFPGNRERSVVVDVVRVYRFYGPGCWWYLGLRTAKVEEKVPEVARKEAGKTARKEAGGDSEEGGGGEGGGRGGGAKGRGGGDGGERGERCGFSVDREA
jgi:hypothetical protein